MFRLHKNIVRFLTALEKRKKNAVPQTSYNRLLSQHRSFGLCIITGSSGVCAWASQKQQATISRLEHDDGLIEEEEAIQLAWCSPYWTSSQTESGSSSSSQARPGRQHHEVNSWIWTPDYYRLILVRNRVFRMDTHFWQQKYSELEVKSVTAF